MVTQADAGGISRQIFCDLHIGVGGGVTYNDFFGSGRDTTVLAFLPYS